MIANARISSILRPRRSTLLTHRIRLFATTAAKAVNDRPVWVLTDGGIQSTLSGMALGKRLGHVELKTVAVNKGLQVFPPIVQKYLVDWFLQRRQDNRKAPWYLTLKEGEWGDSKPDFVICSAPDAVPACLSVSKNNPTTYSVYVGYPNIPFLYFDQVVLPKYEMDAKLAKLGPFYSKQKNSIATQVPLLDLENGHERYLQPILPASFLAGGNGATTSSHNMVAVIIGGYTPQCRWYSEDASSLADNMQRMVKKLHAKIVVVFTEKTTAEVKTTIKQMCSHQADSIAIWDAMADTETSLTRAQIYQSIIDKASRVVVTADLDYAVAHAAAKRKPVYVAFGDRCRQHLLRFHRWARDNRITRKLRLDRGRGASRKQQQQQQHHPLYDPYSYLGNHGPWANGHQLVENEAALEHVQYEVTELRQERVTGKRRKD
ncbi:mitochondrial fission ELM1-domain-containing protein [Zychaea mexicana]|uniref:mitochondrial fission ELM1-domain-containing protein n=1 Tax=Zychaea mexicana TaxID=64656 RepID=UPI0022FDFE8B|nr:mitochondrial fission ELM1-domain-containing protein [Zychaea mexicana]KAI9496175.1 mitochondrial fission ELM1-domain-containing protein [Zychaea mexicana]